MANELDAHQKIERGLLPPWITGYGGIDSFVAPSWDVLDKIEGHIKKMAKNVKIFERQPFRITWAVDIGYSVDTILTVWVETNSIRQDGTDGQFEIFFDFVGGVSTSYITVMSSFFKLLATEELIVFPNEETWKKDAIERLQESFRQSLDHLSRL